MSNRVPRGEGHRPHALIMILHDLSESRSLPGSDQIKSMRKRAEYAPARPVFTYHTGRLQKAGTMDMKGFSSTRRIRQRGCASSRDHPPVAQLTTTSRPLQRIIRRAAAPQMVAMRGACRTFFLASRSPNGNKKCSRNSTCGNNRGCSVFLVRSRHCFGPEALLNRK